jgi:hypothetical protein
MVSEKFNFPEKILIVRKFPQHLTMNRHSMMLLNLNREDLRIVSTIRQAHLAMMTRLAISGMILSVQQLPPLPLQVIHLLAHTMTHRLEM